MRSLFAFLVITALAAVGYAQAVKVETVRSSNGIVKGAPYSAEAVTETNQVLADGNKITRRSVTRLYRDSEGRSRREDLHVQLGVPGAVVDIPDSISITDPVAGVRYQLDPKKNSARQSPFKVTFDRPELKMIMPEKPKVVEPKEMPKTLIMGTRDSEPLDEARKAEMVARAAERQKQAEARRLEMEKQREEMNKQREEMQKQREALKPAPGSSDSNTRTEALGVQNIEGVPAEGSRTTTIIPAGAIGNEREIEVVYEKWYSKELQMTVFSRRSDPRTGEQTYRLTNINRNDPPITLFAPPADYTVVDASQPKPKTPILPKVSTTVRKTSPATSAKKPAVH